MGGDAPCFRRWKRMGFTCIPARGWAYLFASLGEDVPEVFDDLGVHDHFAFVNAHLSYHVDEVATCTKHTQPAVNAPVQQCKF